MTASFPWRRAAMALAAALLATGGLVALASGSPAAAETLFGDDFEDGNAAGWTTNGGFWSVANDAGGKVYRQWGTGANARSRAGDPAWTDVTVVARVRPGTLRQPSSVGVLARVQSSTSYYYLTLRPGTVELGKVIRGTPTVLASQPLQVVAGTWYTLTFVAHGSLLTGSVEGLGVQANDASLASGAIGLVSNRASASFDDVVVDRFIEPDRQPPSTPAAPTIVNVTPTTITLSWAPSTDNVAVLDYTVYRGDGFFAEFPVLTVTHTGPVDLPVSAGAPMHFAIRARDTSGNLSALGSRAFVTQPPTFPRTGNDTVPPSAPGAPVLSASPTGGFILSWAPATDNIGVVEYHVYHSFNVDQVAVDAKVPGTSVSFSLRGGGFERVWIVAYDASWNSAQSPIVGATIPTPTPTTPPPG